MSWYVSDNYLLNHDDYAGLLFSTVININRYNGTQLQPNQRSCSFDCITLLSPLKKLDYGSIWKRQTNIAIT